MIPVLGATLLTWALIIVGALAAMIALMAAVGALLPKDHVGARRARFAAARRRIWKTLTDVDAYPTWRGDLRRVEKLPDRPDGSKAWREIGPHGPIAFEIAEASPPARLVTRIADPSLPFGGTWTYELEPAGEGTFLTITERGEVKNVVFRFMARFVFGYVGTIEQVLRALGRHLGEEVTPEPVPDRG